jgi:exopolysaccharide production protein ExoQ
MKTFRAFEKFYVVIAMLFLAGGVIQRAVAEDDPTVRTQANPGNAVGQLIVYSILLLLLFVHWRKILAGLRQSGWMIALCGLAIASAAWSSEPLYTARRGIVLSVLTAFAIYVASCFEWDEQLDLFGWLSVLAVAGSAFMAVFIPSYGISQDMHWGSVKGLFQHKNIMGGMMVFAILTMFLAKPKGIPAWLRNTSLIGACLLLVLSNSATAIVTMVVCIAMYPILHLIRVSGKKTLPLWIPLVPVVAMGGYLVALNLGFLAEATGRSATLTGRIPMWNAVLSAIGRHPWLGYGYDVFWHNYSIDLAKMKYTLQFLPFHAHNGYLDILLSIGVVGLVVFLGGFVTYAWRAGKLLQSDEIRGAKWPLFVLLFFAVYNLATSALLRPMTFFWIPYVTIYVSLGLLKVEERKEALAELPIEPGAVQVETEGRSGVDGILPGYST